MTPYYHVGIIVEDIEAAMAELSGALGVSWPEPHISQYGEWTIKVAYSVEGPPYIELIEGEPGGPWDTSRGPRLDHIGIMSSDVPGECARLSAQGLPLTFEPTSVGKPFRFCFHELPTIGAKLEVVTDGVQNYLDSLRPRNA